MIINSTTITPAKVGDIIHLGSLNWSIGTELGLIRKNGIIIDTPALMPSLQDGVLSVSNITFDLAIELNDKRQKIYYDTATLKVKTYNDGIDILLEDIDLTLIADLDASQQVLEFVSYDQQLFKIQDETKDQEFDIIFQVIVNNTIAQEIFYRFNYKLSNNTGDVNGDGFVDLRDLVELSDHVMNIKQASHPMFADVNNDGVIDELDIIELSNRI